MLIKGALHIHSLASNDGQLSLPRIADLYRGRDFQFICIAEHSEDMTEQKIAMSRQKAEYLSDDGFCIIGASSTPARISFTSWAWAVSGCWTHRIRCAWCATSAPPEPLRCWLIRAASAGTVPRAGSHSQCGGSLECPIRRQVPAFSGGTGFLQPDEGSQPEAACGSGR